MLHDSVNSPNHYITNGVECKDFMFENMGPELYAGYCIGNVIKYIWRAGDKGNIVEDLRKARRYMQMLEELYEKADIPNLPGNMVYPDVTDHFKRTMFYKLQLSTPWRWNAGSAGSFLDATIELHSARQAKRGLYEKVKELTELLVESGTT